MYSSEFSLAGINPLGTEIKTHKRLILIATIFILSFAIRLLRLYIDPQLLRDSVLYIELADIWSETSNYSDIIAKGTITPPLPLYFIKELMNLGFSAEIAGRSLSLFTGAFVPVIGYFLAQNIFKNHIISLLFSLFLTINPALVFYSTQPLRESNYLFFTMFSGLFGIKAIIQQRKMDWVLCGCFISLSFFCRYESLELLVAIPLIVLFLILWGKMHLKNSIQNVAFLYLGFCFVSLTLIIMIGCGFSFIKRISEYNTNTIDFSGDGYIFKINPESGK